MLGAVKAYGRKSAIFAEILRRDSVVGLLALRGVAPRSAAQRCPRARPSVPPAGRGRVRRSSDEPTLGHRALTPTLYFHLPLTRWSTARLASRSASFFFNSSRLSYWALPLPTPSRTLTRPFFQ